MQARLERFSATYFALFGEKTSPSYRRDLVDDRVRKLYGHRSRLFLLLFHCPQRFRSVSVNQPIQIANLHEKYACAVDVLCEDGIAGGNSEIGTVDSNGL